MIRNLTALLIMSAPALASPPTPISANLIPQIVTGIIAAGDGSCVNVNVQADGASDASILASAIVESLKNDQQVVGTLTPNVTDVFGFHNSIYEMPIATRVRFTALVSTTRRTQVDIYLSQDQKSFYGLRQSFQNLNSANQWQDDPTEVRCGGLAPTGYDN